MKTMEFNLTIDFNIYLLTKIMLDLIIIREEIISGNQGRE